MSRKYSLSIGIVLGIVILLASVFTLYAQDGKQKLLTPADIVALIDKSANHYVVSPASTLEGVDPDNYFEHYFPESDLLIRPWVEKTDGGPVLQEFRFDSDAMKLSGKGETAFAEERYDDAIEWYKKAYAKSENFYLALTDIGDCYFAKGEFEKALDYFNQAIQKNPYDYQPFFFKADALFALGRKDEGLKTMIHALTLKPHHSSIVSNLRSREEAYGITLYENQFHPRALARREGNDIKIYYNSSDGPIWLSYAMAKALWIGEPSHRKEMTGDTTHQWSIVEERECLLALVATYLSLREKGKTEKIPELERLEQIIKDGYLDPYIVYELGSRSNPYITLVINEKGLESVEQYVAKYVVVANR